MANFGGRVKAGRLYSFQALKFIKNKCGQRWQIQSSTPGLYITRTTRSSFLDSSCFSWSTTTGDTFFLSLSGLPTIFTEHLSQQKFQVCSVMEECWQSLQRVMTNESSPLLKKKIHYRSEQLQCDNSRGRILRNRDGGQAEASWYQVYNFRKVLRGRRDLA